MRRRIVSGVLSTLGAVNHESDLAGVAGELTGEEAAALVETTGHPALRRLLELRRDRPAATEDPQDRGE